MKQLISLSIKQTVQRKSGRNFFQVSNTLMEYRKNAEVQKIFDMNWGKNCDIETTA